MLFEQGIKMFSGVFVAIFIARHFGPTYFGVLNYIIAFVAVFIPFTQLGMSLILVRELVESPKQRKEILSTAFYLIFVFSILIIIILNTLNFLFNKGGEIKYFITLYSFGLIFKCFDIIDYNFQSQLKAKSSSQAKSISVLLSSFLKLIIIYLDAPFKYLIYTFFLDLVFLALFLIIYHWQKKQSNFLFGFKLSMAKKLLKSSWPIVLSTLSVILYMKTDQLMIQYFLGDKALGLYSSAVRLYDGYTAIIFTLTISILPLVLKFKNSSNEEYQNLLIKFFRYLFWGSNLVALIVMIFSTSIIELLYGKEFIGAEKVLSIVFWTTSFAAIGSLTSRYLIVEKMEKKIFFRTFVALCFNVIMNIFFIPKFGIEGAASATLISLIIGNYAIDFLDKDLELLRRMKTKAIFLS